MKNLFIIIALSVFCFATLSAQEERADQPKSEARQYIAAFEKSAEKGNMQKTYEKATDAITIIENKV